MPPSGPIADYLDALASELSFDCALARRVRAEVEDHLHQAVAERCEGSALHAIRAFGDPRALARQYVASSLFAQVRRVGVVMIVAVVAIFFAMKGRVAWYGLVDLPASDALRAAGAIGLPIDRAAFLLAVGVALLGFLYIATRRLPAELDAAWGRQLGRCAALCSTVAAALVGAIAVETVLTLWRLMAAAPSAASLVPALSLAAEIAAAALLAREIRAMIRRRSMAAALLDV
jgi:hypothetical protein